MNKSNFKSMFQNIVKGGGDGMKKNKIDISGGSADYYNGKLIILSFKNLEDTNFDEDDNIQTPAETSTGQEQ